MWPLARLRSRSPSSIPVPSSATTNVADEVSRLSATVARLAPAWRTTLLSSSRAAPNSRSSTGVCDAVRPAVEVDVDGEVVTAAAGDEVADRLRQTDAVEHRRVQLGDGRAQHARRFGEGVVDAGERPGVIAVADVLQVVAGGEDVLQRAVVQPLRQHLALALLDVDEVVEEAGAVGDQLADRPDAASAGCATGRSPRSRRWRASACAWRSIRWARRWPPAWPSSPARYTSTVGTTTAAQMPGRSCVAASTGSRKKPTTSTSDDQLSLASIPASSVRVASTARSTNRPSQAHWATAGTARPRPATERRRRRRRSRDDDPVRHSGLRRRHDGEGEGEEHDERAAQQQLEAHPPVGVLEHGRRQLQHRIHPGPYADPAPVREERWPRARSGCEW